MTDEQKKENGEQEIICDLDIQTDYLTASGLITDKPCWVYCMIPVASDDAYSLFYVRDGELVTSSIRFGISLIKYDSIPLVFGVPVRFKKGLYIEFSANGEGFFVQYKPDY